MGVKRTWRERAVMSANDPKRTMQHVVVDLRSIGSALDAPEVDDVADEVNAIGVAIAEKIEEGFGLIGLGA
jgi:hypothetical protein